MHGCASSRAQRSSSSRSRRPVTTHTTASEPAHHTVSDILVYAPVLFESLDFRLGIVPPALNRKSISPLLTAARREKLLISAADLCKAHTRILTDAEQSLTCCVLKADSVTEMLERI